MGIYVGGTGSANHLDDYEEGVWNPAPSGSSTDGTYNKTGEGYYIKIGRQVRCWLNITGNLSGAAGQTRIKNLPFTNVPNSAASGYSAAYGAGNVSYWAGGGGDIMGALIPNNATYMYFHFDDGQGTGANTSITNGNHNGHVEVCFFTA